MVNRRLLVYMSPFLRNRLIQTLLPPLPFPPPKLDCCGAQEYKDWANTTFSADTNSVPDSCCISDIEGCGQGMLSINDNQVRT